MPELPEVEVVRRGLDDHVVGRAFVTSRVTGSRVARRHLPGPQHLADALLGRRVASAQRRGKYLWVTFEDVGPGSAGSADATVPLDRREGAVADDALVIHLGMSGQVLVESADSPLEKHAHAVFDLSAPVKLSPPRKSGERAGSGEAVDAPGVTDASERPRSEPSAQQMRFVDQRTFGGLFLDDLTVAHGREVPASIAHIAPDPLEEAFDAGAVARLMRSKDVAIKRMLLDQGIVSGIGNIYADEALWRAKVHGRRPGRMLTKTQLIGVLTAAQDVMRSALDHGGTSFDALYVNVNGASGYFDRSLDAYGQQGKPCRRCGTLIVREQFMNRSSHFCPTCQKPPRTMDGS